MRMTTARFIGITIGGAAAVGALLYVFGLRFEMSGGGTRPIFKFERKDSHYSEIEERAARDRQALLSRTASKGADTASASGEVPAADRSGGLDSGAPIAKKTAVGESQVPAAETTVPWPEFYGPNRDGRYAQTAILTEWPAKGLKEIWRRPVGGGYASMAVAGGRLFTIEQRRDKETVVAYDFQTGREMWANSWPGLFQESMGGDGPRATPTYDAGRIYALGASGEFRCLDANTGKALWRKNILEENGASNLQWGMAASPLVVDGKVIVLPGGGAGRSVVAYDKLTGARVWGALDDQAAYAAPMVATLAGRRQLVIMTARRVAGLEIESGNLLWETPWTTQYDVNSAMPVVAGANRIVLTSGYGTGAKLVEIGRQGAGFAAKDLWSSQSMKCKFNNAVLHNGVVYGLDEGILAAMDLETGARLWKGGRYGYGQVLLAGDHLVVTTEMGDVALVKTARDGHHEVARFEALDGKTWNVPALADGMLLVRNTTEMACYRIAP